MSATAAGGALTAENRSVEIEGATLVYRRLDHVNAFLSGG